MRGEAKLPGSSQEGRDMNPGVRVETEKQVWSKPSVREFEVATTAHLKTGSLLEGPLTGTGWQPGLYNHMHS